MGFEIKIGDVVVGDDHPPAIVAEVSANHNGDIGRAKAIISAAKDAGADLVKLQFYDPVRLAHARGGINYRLQSGPWSGRTLLDIYAEGHTPLEWAPELFDHASNVGITAFASVFDVDYIPLVNPFVPAFKVSSFEVRNIDLVSACANTGKPLILSTGMASMDDICDALDAVYEVSDYPATILHCVSDYPCPIDKANLSRMSDLIATFGSPVGFSDHTIGSIAAVAAVAKGAVIIEKHMTLSRADGGLDAEFSMEPDEFADLVANCRDAWMACRPVAQVQTYSELRATA